MDNLKLKYEAEYQQITAEMPLLDGIVSKLETAIREKRLFQGPLEYNDSEEGVWICVIGRMNSGQRVFVYAGPSDFGPIEKVLRIGVDAVLTGDDALDGTTWDKDVVSYQWMDLVAPLKKFAEALA